MAYTTLNLEIRSKAENFTGTDFCSKHQFLQVFKKIAPELGVSPTCGYLLCTLFDYSHCYDWKYGRPIVWPSNDELLNCVGGSRRQLQYNIKQLIDLGLIVRVISAEGRRYGRRDNEGRIIEAYGFDLSPLAFRYAEFKTLLKNKEKHTAKRKALKKGITGVFKNINEFMENTKESVDLIIGEIAHIAKTIYNDSRRQRNVATLEVDFSNMNALYDQLKKQLEDAQTIIPALYSPPIAPRGAMDCTRNTINEFITKNVYVDEGQFENVFEEIGEHQEDYSECEFSELVERYKVKPIHILMFCTIFRQYMPNDTDIRWIHITQAANQLYPTLGISENQWNRAKAVIGEYGAGVIVAILIAKGQKVKSPSKYLHYLLNQAIIRALNLGPTVMSLLKSCEEYRENRRKWAKADELESQNNIVLDGNGLQKSTREMTLEEDLNDHSWANTAVVAMEFDNRWAL